MNITLQSNRFTRNSTRVVNQACNSRSRELYNQRMTAETPEAREARLAIRRVTDRARRDAETPEARARS